MNHKAANIIASSLWVIGWVVLGGGIIASVIIAISASTVAAKLGFLLGGLAVSAVMALMLMAVSKLLTLLISIDGKLGK